MQTEKNGPILRRREKVSEIILQTCGLTKGYRQGDAVSDVTFQQCKGTVLAMLGPNGAGKTTTIRMILDIIRPDSGRSSVFGLSSRQNGVAIRRRTGYVPERPGFVSWMSIKQIMTFTGSFYPTWDHEYASILVNRFDLNLSAKTGSLSRGEEAKLALLLALSHHPELLILDDATSGIDPSARKDILEGLIGHLHQEGVSILFATHLLSDIEGLADEVLIMKGSKLLYSDEMESLKKRFKCVRLWSQNDLPDTPEEASIISCKASSRSAEWIVRDYNELDWQVLMEEYRMEVSDLSLEEIYLSLLPVDGE
jgi:ABC-2 type transport system ATP-binding protein